MCILFCISSYAIENWILVADGKRTAAIVIATVMICRGSYLIGLMTENRPMNYQFKRVNEPYLKAEAYPKAIYYLFGYWLKASSARSLEFPENNIYYRDPGQ